MIRITHHLKEFGMSEVMFKTHDIIEAVNTMEIFKRNWYQGKGQYHEITFNGVRKNWTELRAEHVASIKPVLVRIK